MHAADADPDHLTGPGRICPPSYRYAPEALAGSVDLEAETLYVAGGLYGNRAALDAVLRLHESEPGRSVLVFNGDFNWFNVDPAGFRSVNEQVLVHAAVRGNVETEVVGSDPAIGCGCAYPSDVPDEEVERSNRIMARLRETAAGFPLVSAHLAALPAHLLARVEGIRVAVVHGDAESLAGWRFSERALDDPRNTAWVRAAFRRAGVRVFASSHTCLPVAKSYRLEDGRRGVVVNNGAAGLPNFRGTRYGLVTRISGRPAPPAARPLYGAELDGVHVDALPVTYDHRAWRREFLANWPPGSAAFASYARRIEQGPDYDPRRAARGAVRLRARQAPDARGSDSERGLRTLASRRRLSARPGWS